MRVDGYWLLCNDGTFRPVIPGAVLATDGNWVSVRFLADSAADRTVLIADVVPRLHLSAEVTELGLMGVGGRADSVIVQARIRFLRETTDAIYFTGSYAAFTEKSSADMSVLGRDITNQFALIIDRPQDLVCLLGQGHRYTITAG